ncbi:MAG: hypothetical protein H0T62_02075 [Parachlamydiaceae bacterium]|nr:hypothetical protein [Parachlamydiaceae bacterium]
MPIRKGKNLKNAPKSVQDEKAIPSKDEHTLRRAPSPLKDSGKYSK